MIGTVGQISFQEKMFLTLPKKNIFSFYYTQETWSTT